MNKKQVIVLLVTIGVFISVYVYTTFFRKTELVSDIRKDQELQVEWELVSGCSMIYTNGTTTRQIFSIEVPSSIEADKQSLSQECINPSGSDSPFYDPKNYIIPSINPEVFSTVSHDMKYLIFIKKDANQANKYNLFFSNLMSKTLFKVDQYVFLNEITESQREYARLKISYSPHLSEQIAAVFTFADSEMFRVEGDKYIIYSWYSKNSGYDYLPVTQKVKDINGQLVFQPNCDTWGTIESFNTDLSKILYSCDVILPDSSRSVSYYIFDFVNIFNLQTPYPPTALSLEYKKFVGTSTIEFLTDTDEISRELGPEKGCTASRYHMDIDGGNLKYMGRVSAGCF